LQANGDTTTVRGISLRRQGSSYRCI